MLYVDSAFLVPDNHPTAPRCFKGKLAAHLTADTEEELVAYAVSIGMRREWLQKRGTAYCHFDVTGSRLTRVQCDPAVRKIGAKDMARLFLARQTS